VSLKSVWRVGKIFKNNTNGIHVYLRVKSRTGHYC
jgi:hypothetical protein